MKYRLSVYLRGKRGMRVSRRVFETSRVGRLLFLSILVLPGMLTGGAHCWAAAEDSPEPKELPVLRMSLRDAMEASVDQNPTVRLFKERITQAEEIADTQLGTLLPNLSGRMSYARRRFFFGQFGGNPSVSDPIDFYQARAHLTQNVFSLSLIQKWRAAKTGVDVAGLEAEVTKRDTMATVGLVYLEALRAIAAVDARKADVKLNKELLRLAAERKVAGMATRLDVTRAKVQVENERQRLIVAENSRDRSLLNLIRAIGLSFDVEVQLTDKLEMVKVPTQTIQQALTVARENRTELKTQKQKERLASLNLSSVTSERIPSIEASGDVGMIGNQIPDMLTTDNVQVLMTVPIWDGGSREARISESRSIVRQEAINTQDIEYQVTLEVRDALLTLGSARQQVAVAQEGLKLALVELELARERFAVGVATNIEVTNAQTSLAQARDNLIQGLFVYNAARIGLARSQGRLTDL